MLIQKNKPSHTRARAVVVVVDIYTYSATLRAISRNMQEYSRNIAQIAGIFTQKCVPNAIFQSENTFFMQNVQKRIVKKS